MISKHQQTVRLLRALTLFWLLLTSACVPIGGEFHNPTNAPGDVKAAVGAQSVATNFLTAWQDENYSVMYGLLSSLSADAISPEAFEDVYKNAAQNLTLEKISFQVISTMAEENHAEVAYQVDFNTQLLGVISRDMVMGLTREMNAWRIQWHTGLILPELQEGNYLQLVHDLPSRGRIFDQAGAPLASYEDAIAVGIVPGNLLAEQAEQVYQTLAEISIYDPDTLRNMVESTPPDWYLPIVTLSQADMEPYLVDLRNVPGIRLDSFRARYYVDGGVAPHVLGYMGYITAEELDSYLRMGYQQDERIGRSGLEAVYEDQLSGQRGGSLYLMSEGGKIQSMLAASDSIPGRSLYTTLDKELQMRLQASLGELRAAVVVMEVDSGRILALVSNPHFDPNAFDLSEIDRSLLDSYFSDENQPLFNRATQGQYPLGSVFKTITMSAGLEEGLYRPSSSFYCGHRLWVCDSAWLDDWTLGHGTAASGDLTLTEGLMRSCNPWFYRIGESLFEAGMEEALSDMAVGFGLGAQTGIEIAEAAGNIPETAGTCLNSAQMSIGQGEILVTPLQVARFFAALANGGTLYHPSLVAGIKSPTGEMTYEFSPKKIGTLPISEQTLSAVQEGLRMVVEEERGTGYWALQGLDVLISGKTGTAQTPSGDPHAWFAGYTRQNDPEHPDIAVAVIVENGGEGSVMAAPVFRRVVSLYFSDNQDPGGLMPWEAEPYEILQPTPTVTLSPSDE